MVSNVENKVCLSLVYRNKQVKVTLEFPERSDQKAEQEFISRLKAIYLEKIDYCHDLYNSSMENKEENGNE